jgi:hypothetical protein
MIPSSIEERRLVAAIRRAAWHVDAARVELALENLKQACLKANFNPNQPRVPAGNPDGGQWTSEAGGGGSPGIDDSRVLSDASPDPDWIPGAQYAQNRTPLGQFPGATPGQNARLAVAELRASAAIRRVNEVDSIWQPRVASLTAPNSIEGAIGHAEARAHAAEMRLRELARRPHDQLLEAYRRSNATPDLFANPWSRQQHAVAVATPGEEQIFFGTNSRAPTYTDRDFVVARRAVEIMIDQFPRVMSRRVGEWPNHALHHAESTVLLRMRESLGGTLAGRSFTVTVDRPICGVCRHILPSLGEHLGNPRVTYYDSGGLRGIMHHREWLHWREK